jgi:cellulose synthase/poly-beta-1,6-N-acetylglucosamine synthase-like glycosyltransferase
MFRTCGQAQFQLVNSLTERINDLTLHRVLKYVKGAIGETDVPEALPEFISQRRRWLNGSFFAATYAIAHVGQILRSGHSLTRKVLLMVETVYNIINMVFAWFSVVSNLKPSLSLISDLLLSGKFLSVLCVWSCPPLLQNNFIADARASDCVNVIPGGPLIWNSRN